MALRSAQVFQTKHFNVGSESAILHAILIATLYEADWPLLLIAFRGGIVSGFPGLGGRSGPFQFYRRGHWQPRAGRNFVAGHRRRGHRGGGDRNPRGGRPNALSFSGFFPKPERVV